MSVQLSQRSQAWLVSLAMPGDENRQRSLVQSTRRHGEFAGTVEWSLDRATALDVFHRNAQLRDLLPNPKLALWKPAIILEQLRAIPDGDVVVYHDVGQGFWGEHTLRMSIAPVIEWAVAQNGGLLPGAWLPEDGRNARWTTRYCFATMECDEERFWSTPQIQTTYSIWHRNRRTLEFVEAWLSACLAVYGAPASSKTLDENFSDFVEDRGAQSILTNLAVRANVECFGRPCETTSAITHPSYSRIPATDIGNLRVRIGREQDLHSTKGARAGSLTHPNTERQSTAGRIALFTSIPPRLDRRSVDGISIGDRYQAECIQSWLRCGFEIYSVHYRDELPKLRRYEGVTYVAAERSEREDPREMKPSLRIVMEVVKRSGVEVPGIVNSDILLLNSPGWVDAIRREITKSVIAVTRYETNDIDRTCIGWAPWGFDVIFFDPFYIDRLQYCDMRLGECWWDYWLPLSLYFEGAALKHVEDFVALHQDHPIVSSNKIHEYAERFIAWLALLADADRSRSQETRVTETYDICQYRFPIEAARIGVSVGRSYRFLTEVVNPTVWAIICMIARANPLEVVPKDNAHHRLLADVMLRAVQHSAQLQQRLDDLVSMHPTVVHARGLSQSWSYRFDWWLGNVVRRLRGKPPKLSPRIETLDQASLFMRELDRRPIWALAGPLRYARTLVAPRNRNATSQQLNQQSTQSSALTPRTSPDDWGRSGASAE
jgi:hypothetical protein